LDEVDDTSILKTGLHARYRDLNAGPEPQVTAGVYVGSAVVDVELLALAAAGASWAALAAGVSLFPSIFAAFAVMALIGLNRRRP
jgi:hypothetical protein